MPRKHNPPRPAETPRGVVGVDYDTQPAGCSSLFLDSGSFSLWKRAKEWAKKGGRVEQDYYRTKEFFKYLDTYAKFVTKYKAGIDHYANVDAIGHADLTYRNQKILEDEYGLNPVPVVHYRTDPVWVSRYVADGHDFIALGGLVGSHGQEVCRDWIDRCFSLICSTAGYPEVKLHGFGVTSVALIIRYPWFSIDSSTWTQCGAWGGIIVPPKRGGKYRYDVVPYTIKISDESPDRKRKGQHFYTLTPNEQSIIREWLDHVGVPLGRTDEDGTVEVYGAVNRHSERKAANLSYFELLRKSRPDWPWRYTGVKRKGLF